MIPTLQEIKNQFTRELESIYSPQEAGQLIWILLEESLELNRAQLLLALSQHPEIETWKLIQNRFSSLKNGTPLQYILGHTSFYGLKFKVNEHTLIPRPETEELVNHIVQEHAQTTEHLSILDIGTGSGCIAISLAKLLPNATVYGIDISEATLKIARENAFDLGVNVQFELANILEWETFLPENLAKISSAQWDIIVSNPPYIPSSESIMMQQNVLEHEPHVALFVPDKDPLIFYRCIGRFADCFLKQTGQLWFEIHESLADEYLSYFSTTSLGTAELIRDINNKNRMLRICK